MENIVTFYYRGIRVRQKRERIAHFTALGCGSINWIDSNRDNAHTALFEIRQPRLKTPQLGVT